jgi:hypothetical protein
MLSSYPDTVLPSVDHDYNYWLDPVAGIVNPTEFNLSVPGSNNSSIDYTGDVDTYRVYLPGGPGYSYDFDVHGETNSAGGTFDPIVALYDGNGTRVAIDDDSGSGLNSHIDYEALSGGWYTLVVAGYGTGGYTVSASVDDGIV